MDLELVARLDGLLVVCQLEVAPFVGRLGQLAQERGQEEEPVPCDHFLHRQPRARSEHSG